MKRADLQGSCPAFIAPLTRVDCLWMHHLMKCVIDAKKKGMAEGDGNVQLSYPVLSRFDEKLVLVSS